MNQRKGLIHNLNQFGFKKLKKKLYLSVAGSKIQVDMLGPL
jgi:hypothetical protein